MIREIKEEVDRIKQKKKSRKDFREKFSKYSRAMKSLGIDPKEAFKKMVALSVPLSPYQLFFPGDGISGR